MKLKQFVKSSIVLLILINMVSLQVADTKAQEFIKEGLELKYSIIKINGDNKSEEIRTYRITSVVFTGQKLEIKWETDTKSGTWDGSTFGKPVVYPGEKWENTNNAFYHTVSTYKSMLSAEAGPIGKVKYDFKMGFFYLYMFKGLPRWGKIYDFWGEVRISKELVTMRIISHVDYLANGVAKKIIYEESYDMNGDGNITKSEVNREEWTLVDWNASLFAAVSPIIWALIFIAVVAIFILLAKYIIKKYGVIIVRERG